MRVESLGGFEVKSGKMIFSDPGYDGDDGLGENISKVPKGTWNSFVIKEGDRCAYLLAFYDKFKVSVKNAEDILELNWKDEENALMLGVDSGQLGFFDLKYYKDDKIVKNVKRIYNKIICGDEPWYSICCDRSLSEMGAGTIPYGVVSESGFGDGAYPLSFLYNKKQIVGIMVNFLIFDNEENEDNEDKS